MKKVLILFMLLNLLWVVPCYAQLTEDFNCDNPPCSDVLSDQWQHEPTFDPANASGRWSFVNPSDRSFPVGFNDDVLIFDAEFQPNGLGDTASVITPIANCANSSNVFLKMTHLYMGGPGAKGMISVSANEGPWIAVKTFYNSLVNPADEILNITNIAAGRQNVRVKFTWESPLELGYWAITYMEILSPVLLDASIVSLLSPTAPLSSNQQDVIVSVMNTGATEINSIAFNISIGELETSVMWYGTIPICGIVDSIFLGSFEFLSGVLSGVNVSVSEVNGVPDIGVLGNNVTTAVAAPLCGTYTIGGGASDCPCANCPNFENFTAASNFLNTYGVSCQTEFLVSPGLYNEQIQLGSIYGSSEQNNIIFRGCGQSSTMPQLVFHDPASSTTSVVELNGTDFITFEYLEVRSDNPNFNAFYIHGDNVDVTIQHCITSDVTCGVDGSVFPFRFVDNHASGYDLMLNQISSGDTVIVRDNWLDSLVVLNSNNLWIENNRGGMDTASVVTSIQFYECNEVVASSNRIRRMVTSGCSELMLDSNFMDTLYSTECTQYYFGSNDFNVGNFNSGENVRFESNEFKYCHFYATNDLQFLGNEAHNSYDPHYQPGLYAVRLHECADVVMRSNSLYSDYGVYVEGASSVNVVVANNYLEPFNDGRLGMALSFNNLNQWARADSNVISGFMGNALYAYCPSALPNANIRFNSNSVLDGLNSAIYVDAGAIEVGRNRVLRYSGGSAVFINGAESKVHNNYIHLDGISECIGIEVGAGAISSSFCFNSILIKSSDQYQSAALKVSELYGPVDFKNNCFSNEGNGFGVVISGSADLNVITGGKNNFYSLYDRLAKYNGVTINAWSDFISSMGGLAANAINVIPMYTSDVELQCNHFDLNNSGMYCDMSADFDYVLRPSNAIDIGAKMWDLCANDAGVTAFNNLMNPLNNDSLYPMYVTLMNMGSNQLTSAEIGWTINGILQTQSTWSGNLNPGQSELFFMGFYQFSSEDDVLFELSAFINSANNQEDCNHYNDTIVSIKYAIPLCGTIFVGSEPDDQLENFTELSEVLNLSGIACQTLVLVREGEYNEKFIVDSIPGSNLYSLLIQSFNNDANSVVLGSTLANPAHSILFHNTRHLRVDQIKVISPGGDVAAVYFDANAYDITISGCNISGRISQSEESSCRQIKLLNNTCNGGDINLNGASGDCENYLISNNTGLANIHLAGLENVTVQENSLGGNSGREFSIDADGISGELILEGNSLTNIFQGISISNCDSVYVRHNEVFLNMEGNNFYSYGIRLLGLNYLQADTNYVTGTIATYGMSCDNSGGDSWFLRGNIINGICGKSMIVSGNGGLYSFNQIRSGKSGVGIDCFANGAAILNNYIDMNSDVAFSGLRLEDQSIGDTIAFNTVAVSGQSSDVLNAAAISGIDHLIVNNIFAAYGGAVAMNYLTPPSNFTSNYNCYYSEGGNVWRYNNQYYTSLGSYLAAAGLAADVNSFVANPFFGENNLIPSQSLLNGSGTSVYTTSTDINGVLRNTITPDIGANELTLCQGDASLTAYVDLSVSMSESGVPLTVTLQNAGSNVLSQTSIHWSINGDEQMPLSLTGLMLSAQSSTNVFIGIIPSGLPLYEIRAWVEGANNSLQDCNVLNDTLSAALIYSALCGQYYIGGVNSDFLDFSQAAEALHLAGVSCPVMIDVEPGNYYEQLNLYEIPGASFNNTITFHGLGSSPSAILSYSAPSNCASGYTLKVDGADYVRFDNIGIYGGNIFQTDIMVRSHSDHLSFHNCILGNTVYDEGAIIAGAEFVNNVFVFPKLILSLATGSSELAFQGNSGLGLLDISHASDVFISDNQIRRINASSFDVGLFEGNSLDSCYASYFDALVMNDNTIATTFISSVSQSLEIMGNSFGYCNVASSQQINCQLNSLQSMVFNGCQFLEVSNNSSSGNGVGLSFNGSNVLNCEGNQLLSKSGINLDNSDNIRIHHNTIDGMNMDQSFGIVTSGSSESLIIDSNIVVNQISGGIHVQSSASDFVQVRYNEISGSGIQVKLSGNRIVVEANRIVNCTDATGLVIDGDDMLAFNNYIQIDGQSVCKGISITNSGASLYYNSVLLNGTNGGNRALEVELVAGSNHEYNIKNNIFSVVPPAGSIGNFASFELNSIPGSNFNCDYNCFYSTNSVVGRIANSPYVSLNAFMGLLLQGGSHHCISVNPNFASNSDLLPYNILINRQGIGLNGLFDLYPGLNLDIDGEIRDNYQPDIGAQEFRANFAVLELIAPTLDCVQSSEEQVIAGIRQYGDIPFFDIQIAYSVNGAPPVYNVIPGAQFNDIDYAFQDALANLSANGQYDFEVWLVNNFDDVAADDTLRVSRYSLPSPWIQSFLFDEDCANEPITFSASATATGGVITSLEWDFGDGSNAVGNSVLHSYDAAADYEVTLFAYRDSACYSDTSGTISLLPTPQISFSLLNFCSATPLQFANGTELLNGTGNMTYLWNFGDGSFSAAANPIHSFDTAGVYHVFLTAQHVVSGSICRDTLSQYYYIQSPPVLNFALEDSYPVNTPDLLLSAQPSGGYFSGSGVENGVLNFSSLAVNSNNLISYTYLDTLTGCYATVSQSVLITPFSDPPVITDQPNEYLTCEGSSFFLSVDVSGALPMNYQWFLNGEVLSGETNPLLMVSASSSLIHQGDYQVRITNQYGTIFSNVISVELGSADTVSLNVVLCPNEFLSFGEFIIADTGDYEVVLINQFNCDSVLNVHVTSGYSDSIEVDTAACAPFAYNGFTFYDDGDYIVVLSNRVGCDSVITLHFDQVQIGESCDDGQSCTINDEYNNDCICAGVLTLDDDFDGLCDAMDICLNNPEPGQPCDDQNPCTYSDIMGEECLCSGLLVPDTDSDGVCDSAEVFGCGDPLACNYNPLTTDNYATCIYPLIGYDCDGNCVIYIDGVCLNLGCTNPAACNYEPAANFDNDSCLFAGCTDFSACNFDVDAGCDNGSCVFPGCLDALACNFDPSAACEDGSCILPGCMDALACNYDVNATCDTGSCIMPSCTDSEACNFDVNASCSGDVCIYPGCQDATACNYDALAGCDNGSCQFAGCLDSMACNFDATAYCDNNSCEFSGCIDTLACNFDSTAGCEGICYYPPQFYNCDSLCLMDSDNDGVCDPLEVFGCVDVNACNYDSSATEQSTESDSCHYAAVGYDCGNSCLLDDDLDGICNPFEVSGCVDEFACNYNPFATDSAMCEYLPVYDIVGEWVVSMGDTVQYSYPLTEGSIYDWTVTGGAIVSGDSTQMISVIFTEPDSQIVSVVEISADGCISSDTTSYLVVQVELGFGYFASYHDRPMVFPNPADDVISVKCLNEWSNGAWRIYSNTANILKSGTLTGNLTNIEVIDLASGVYQIEFISKSGSVVRLSFVKR
jgi:hypothetical protein